MTSAPSGASSLWARRRPLAVAAAVVGGALMVVSGLTWHLSQPAPDVGSQAVAALTTPSPPAPVPGSSVPVRPGSPVPAAPVVVPVHLSIPAISVTAAVVATGVDGNGEFAVPPSVDQVGWYQYGPGLNAGAGSVVIGGHVDSKDQGPGAFFRLRDLRPGQRVLVTGSDGATRTYSVIGREEVAKTQIDLAKYFSASGTPRLTLITCGGEFNSSTGHYRDNIVVTAVPV